jgi:hypothetical protein
MARKLPMPNGVPDPAHKVPVGSQKQAEMWLRWDCGRKGIDFPKGRVLIEFHPNGPRGLAVVSAPLSRVRDLTPGLELLRHDVPAWVVPMAHADLFDAAYQTGKPLSDCLSLGMGYHGRGAKDIAAMDGEAWDRMCANRLLDNAFRDRTIYAEDERFFNQAQDAANMEAAHEIEQDQLDYEISKSRMNRVAA